MTLVDAATDGNATGAVSTPLAWAREAEAARQIAAQAGHLLLELRTSHAGDDLGAVGDRSSHTFIVRELKRLFPGDAILSEEAVDDPARLQKRRVWIVDPLDGTREFTELDRADWAVHVAFTHDGNPVAGAVALPAENRVFCSSDGDPAEVERPARLRLLVSRTRPSPLAEAVASRLQAELVPLGSAGAKVMAVLRGRAEIYLHSGGQFEWDSAAPVAVALAGGLHASRIDGSPIHYNRGSAWLPDLLVCRHDLTEPVLRAIEQASLNSGTGGSGNGISKA